MNVDEFIDSAYALASTDNVDPLAVDEWAESLLVELPTADPRDVEMIGERLKAAIQDIEDSKMLPTGSDEFDDAQMSFRSNMNSVVDMIEDVWRKNIN